MRHWKLALLLAVPAILLTVTLYLGTKPYYNWDMFPYMAVAIARPDVSFDATHREVYSTAKYYLPPEDFTAISQRQPQLMNNPEAFRSVLKYFKIKPGYTIVVSGLHKIGINLVAATYIPSLISYFLFGCLLLWWAIRVAPPQPAASLTLLIMATPLTIDVARLSSPDMLCALVSLAAFVLLFQAHAKAGLFLLTLSLLVRPDSVILLIALSVLLAVGGKIRWSTSFMFILASIGITLVIIQDTGLLLEFLLPTGSSPIESNVVISVYLDGLENGLLSVLNSLTIYFVLVAVAILVFKKYARHPLAGDLESLLLTASLSTLLARYLLHPMVEDRLQAPCYLLIAMVLCSTVAKKLYPTHSRLSNEKSILR